MIYAINIYNHSIYTKLIHLDSFVYLVYKQKIHRYSEMRMLVIFVNSIYFKVLSVAWFLQTTPRNPTKSVCNTSS